MKTQNESKEKKNVPTVRTGLDKRRELTKGRFNAVVIVTLNYKRKYYPVTSGGVKMQLAPKDLRSRETKAILEEAGSKAKAIISTLQVFTFEAFEEAYFSDVIEGGNDLVSALRERSEKLRAKQLKTSIGYETTANSVQEYIGKGKKMEFYQVTPTWLTGYEEYLQRPYMNGKRLKDGRSLTTVGIYMRNLRAVIRPQLTGIDYPFGASKDGKYEIPSGRNVKKALTINDIAKIYNYDLPNGSDLQYFRDLWILSYLCNGANFKDLARLKYSNIDGESILFIRSKTSSTKRANQSTIIVPLTTEIGRIIDRWGSKKAVNDYILPILSEGLTAKQELDRIESAVKKCNRIMRQIAANAGINHDITTYTARHSFATIIMRSGASVEFISKSLGHSSVVTTANYLADFDTDVKRAYAEKLTIFINK